MEDQDAERLSTRTKELTAESELSWRDAWWQSEEELGPDLGLRQWRTLWTDFGFRPRARFRTSTRFNVLWMTAGLLFALVPGIVSQIVGPGWMLRSSSHEAVGGAVYLGLLVVSGLAVAAIGLRFGLTGRSTEGWAAAVRMCVGVVVGTWISVVVIGSGAYDVGLAATLLAMGIAIPYWACAALSLILGSEVLRLRSES